MKKIILHDPTLRDGNHAVKHQITLSQIESYTSLMDKTGIDVVEVGHGLGLGASTLQLGLSQCTDVEILKCARKNLKNSKLGIHITPGYGRNKDLLIGIEHGADIIRVAAHCTEADITEDLIKTAISHHKSVYGCLTMSHMANEDELLDQAKKIESYGAEGVILMDSAGAYTIDEVKRKISLLVDKLSIQVGFHAHNNLGLAVANSLAAAESGASIIDATAKGFGAGAGNTPLELIVAVFTKMKYPINVTLNELLAVINKVPSFLNITNSTISPNNIMSGLYGVFGGFDPHVIKHSSTCGIDPLLVYEELGKRQVIAGQEDLIIEVAYQIKNGLLGQTNL